MIRAGSVISIVSILVLLVGYRPAMQLFLAATPDQTVSRRVAILLPESGEYAAMGQLQMQGYALAAEPLTRSGIEIKYFDTAGYSGRIANMLDSEVAPWEPDVIVGPYHGKAAVGLASHLAGSPVPLIVPTAVVDPVTQQLGNAQPRTLFPPDNSVGDQASSRRARRIVTLHAGRPSYGGQCSAPMVALDQTV